MPDVLLDTDIFIDHLRGARALKPGDYRVFYSSLTRCELFAGTSPGEDELGRLLAPFQELVVDRGVAEIGGRLRKASHILIVDAVIAATALRHDLALYTRNTRHFQQIPNLRLLDSLV